MFKIFDEKEEDSSVFLKLITSGGAIYLAVADKRGHVLQGGYLLRFNDDGTFSRRPGVRTGLGVETYNSLFVERV